MLQRIRPRHWLVVAAACGGAAWLLWPGRDATVRPTGPARVDPRVTYAGPYLNVRPDVGEVGDARCAECHADIAAKYRQHPMGCSVRPAGEVVERQDLSRAAHNPFDALGSRFRVDLEAGRVWQRETRFGPGGQVLYEHSLEARYTVGSGHNGHSYLTDRGGYVFQTPVSWFSQKHVWDESPGFNPAWRTGRPIGAECLFCHANRVEPVAGTLNRFAEPLFRGLSIGCERCHGPGAEHVRLREPGGGRPGVDHTIVNPSHLSPELREAVCQQCHLEGEARVRARGSGLFDFRPGLPLSDFLTVIVRDREGEERKAVNHVEQMYESRCFQKSGGKLGCVTCHNPHEKLPPARQVEQSRATCLGCHDCPTPLADRLAGGRDNRCSDCHMPRLRTADIAHTAATDHRILRKPDAATRPNDPDAGAGRWVFFPRRRPDPQRPDDARALALTMAGRVGAGQPLPEGGRATLLPMLDVAQAAYPDDADLWWARVVTLQAARRLGEARAACDRLLALAPDSESTQLVTAILAQEMQEPDRSGASWNRLVEINPWSPAYRLNQAVVLAFQGKTAEATAAVDACLDLDPGFADGYRLRVELLLREKRLAEAEAAFRKLEALNPPQIAEWRVWFQRARRR